MKQSFIFVMLGIALATTPLQAQEKLVFTTFPSPGISLVFERVLQKAYQRIGIKVEFRELPGERAIQIANEGKADGEAGRTDIITKRYTNLVKIPVPIFLAKIVVFSKNVELPVDMGWESLKPYRIGTLIGYMYIESNLQGMRYWSLPTYEQIFKMLDAGRLDIAVLSKLDGLGVINNLDIKGVKTLEPPLVTIPTYHFLHERHEKLVPQITASLQQMEKEGILKKIWDEVETELRGDSYEPETR